ncbi:collagen alpha-2(I) chain-like [Macrobrachium rosenbergii]|uniref:collagen alpha-2(I) chain-like n=1 Tax=Macrobrachium rosenbergii TaxID=79674 RepID=UPI0034D62D23
MTIKQTKPQGSPTSALCRTPRGPMVQALPRPASPAWQEACLPPGKQPLRRIFPVKAAFREGFRGAPRGPSGKLPWGASGTLSLVWVQGRPPRTPQGPSASGPPRSASQPGKQPLRRIFPSQGCLQGKTSLGCLEAPQPCGSGPPQARFPSLAGNLPLSREAASEEDLPQSRLPPREGFPRAPRGPSALWFRPSPGPLPQPAWQETCLPSRKQPLRRIFPSQGCLQGKTSLGCLGAPQPCGSGPPQFRFPSLAGNLPPSREAASEEDLHQSRLPSREGFLGRLGVPQPCGSGPPRPASPAWEAASEEDLPQSRLPSSEDFPRVPRGPSALWFRPSPGPLPQPGKQPLGRIFPSQGCLQGKASLGRLGDPHPFGSGPPQARFPSLAGNLPPSREAASEEDLPLSRVP